MGQASTNSMLDAALFASPQVVSAHAAEGTGSGPLDLICRLARSLLDVAAACVTPSGATIGVLDGDDFGQPASRIHSFCLCAALTDEPMIVLDAREDRRLSRNPFVKDAGLRFFASIPLLSPDRGRVGTISLLDRKPRSLTQKNLVALRELASAARQHIDSAEAGSRFDEPAFVRNADLDQFNSLCRKAERMTAVGHSILEVATGHWLFSDGMHHILGTSCSSAAHRPTSIGPCIDADQRRFFEAAIELAVFHCRDFELSVRVIRPDGEVRDVVMMARCEASGLGGAGRVLLTCLDVTSQREASRRLTESEDRFHLLADNVSDVVVKLDTDFRFTYASPSCSRLLGYEPGELVGLKSSELLHPDDLRDPDPSFPMSASGAVDGRTSCRRYIRKDRSPVWVEGSIQPLRAAGTDALIGYVASLRDVDDSRVDPVTGLLNRKAFEEQLQAAGTASRSVLVIGIDAFKSLNDTHGRSGGNAILSGFASRLNGIVRRGDCIARIGGDRFGIILVQDADRRTPEDVAQRVQEAALQRFVIGGSETLPVTVSIGIAFLPTRRYGRSGAVEECGIGIQRRERCRA